MDTPDRTIRKAEAAVNDVNATVARRLREYATLLEQQGANTFRIGAYRNAARTIDGLDRPVDAWLAAEGIEGLIALPAIGKGIAAAIAEQVSTGRWSQLERLRGESAPESVFQTLAGIGPALARRLVEEAHLETLEALEAALHRPGVQLPGIGPRRRETLAAILEKRLGRTHAPGGSVVLAPPPVEWLLKVDQMYRERAAAGRLRMIAPRRFNPSGEAWLPVMHASHGQWHFTALFSNTARAHQLGRTRDWVVIFFHDNEHVESRCTVVTETRGPLAGRRVVRGREAECLSYALPGAAGVGSAGDEIGLSG